MPLVGRLAGRLKHPGALLLCAVLAGCGAGVRPMTPRAARLGLGRSPGLPPLRAAKPHVARGFLLPRIVHEQVGPTVALIAPLDGALGPQQSLRWSAVGGAVTPGAPGHATLRPASSGWRVSVALLRGSRVRSEASAEAPGRSLGGPLDLPTEVTVLPLDPAACGSVAFPTRVSRGHVGCGPATPPRIDRFLPWGAPEELPLHAGAARAGGKAPATIHPAEAAARGGMLAWAGDALGTWSGPGRSEARWLPHQDLLGPPIWGAGRLAVLRRDRVELASLGSNQRSLLPATPSDTPGAAAVGSRWLAVLEGPPGRSSLLLRDLERHREATLLGPGDRADLAIEGRWLTWQEGPSSSWLDLETGELRRRDLGGVRGRRSERLDDLWLLPRLRGGSVELLALDLPTGRMGVLFAGGGDLRLRGAAAGGVTVAAGPFGGDADLESITLLDRSLEEPAGLERRRGGHGGTRGWLVEGVLERTVGAAAGRAALTLWREPGDGEGVVEVRLGTAVVARVPHAEVEGPGWVPLASLVLGPEDAGEEALTIRWTAAGEGLAVDALRIRMGRSR